MIKTNFDMQRVLRSEPDDLCEPLYVAQPAISLQDALRAGVVKPNDAAQSFHLEGVTYVFSLKEMIYYHVAQVDGAPLLLTYCLICNGGACFSPIVNGKYHHFAEYGLYDSMTIIRDEESGSIWHHITGVCLHGPLKGSQLESYGTALTTTFGQAWQTDPDAQLVYRPLDAALSAEVDEAIAYYNDDSGAFWEEETGQSVLMEDERLPRLSTGLGVWTDDEACFYPLEQLYQQQNILFDTFNNQRLIVFISGQPAVPRAFYTDAELDTIIRAKEFRLNNGWSIRNGLIYASSGVITPDYPRQMFGRWFGFSLTFPNCRIYQQPS